MTFLWTFLWSTFTDEETQFKPKSILKRPHPPVYIAQLPGSNYVVTSIEIAWLRVLTSMTFLRGGSFPEFPAVRAPLCLLYGALHRLCMRERECVREREKESV